MPSPATALSRRRVLAGAAALAALGAATSCGTRAPQPDVDALHAQADRARSDAQLAAAAATAAAPPLAAALTTIAAERVAHGQALTDELARLDASPPATSAATSTSAPGASAPATPPAPAASSVAVALKQSADAAATAAAQQSGYRAGLLGSIAAACAAAHDVALGGLAAS